MELGNTDGGMLTLGMWLVLEYCKPSTLLWTALQIPMLKLKKIKKRNVPKILELESQKYVDKVSW